MQGRSRQATIEELAQVIDAVIDDWLIEKKEELGHGREH